MLAQLVQRRSPMYRLVTCPETAHLELIDYEDTPLGMLIRECSRFRPACAITCTRTCAARLDQAARRRSCTSEPVEIDDPD